ncbi:MAG TPA: hypothetical protein VH417_17120 [Vicinamibacterales bacterium]
MRLPRRRALRAHALAASLVTAALAVPTIAAAQPTPATVERPSDGDIEQALETAKADPNLSPERKVRTLRWIGAQPQSARAPGLIWLLQTAAWFASSARRLVWIAGGVLLALVVVHLLRSQVRRQRRTAAIVFKPPTHVRDLDIRPETLPADIGAAARALWDAGDRRAALALLYRGLLSRLIHVHRVPIRDSSTEGDCLELAARHLTDTRRQYAAGLIRARQRFVYGGEEIQTALVQTLCDGFAAALDRRPADRLQGESA